MSSVNTMSINLPSGAGAFLPELGRGQCGDEHLPFMTAVSGQMTGGTVVTAVLGVSFFMGSM